jgi:AraC-like DNA-binding protein
LQSTGRLNDLRELNDRVEFYAAVLTSVMPHGRLQIVRASVPDADVVRRYNREGHLEDRPTWDAIRTGEPLRDASQALIPGRSIVLPVASAVFAGYPGALHVIRRDQEAAFTDAEIAALRAWADETGDQVFPPRVFVLDHEARALVHADAWANLDETLCREVTDFVRHRVADLGDTEATFADRRTHAAGRALRQAVRYVVSRDNPAHSGQTGAVVCLQPGVDEWAAITPAAVASHGELTRFLQAMQFSRANAGKSITLNDVAGSVGLSPFHFHRRFVEITGMAPKQYLFDCQIADAQAMLMAGKLELHAIARQCGFAHQSHFTSRFRQATGYTPTRWRKAMLEEQSV